ncbi:MAG: GDSL-type esterase/lipase family protein [Microscillaceae bacterium]|nr:GDSL-type esterase/lipase family protein [Microscillaceae bacterium]
MKRLTYISLILNVLIITLAVFLSYFLNVAAKVKSLLDRNFQKHYERQSQIFEGLPNIPGEIIFLGSDLIEEANWEELLSNPKIKNRGIAGDKTAGVLNRLPEVLAAKPAKIFLLLGYDDLTSGISQKEILNNYQKILEKIKKDSPKTQIYLHSLSPINYEWLGNRIKNEEIIVLNGQISQLAEKYRMTYIDLFPALVGKPETQELKPEYTNDGVHLNAQGYTRWKALLERYIKDE